RTHSRAASSCVRALRKESAPISEPPSHLEFHQAQPRRRRVHCLPYPRSRDLLKASLLIGCVSLPVHKPLHVGQTQAYPSTAASGASPPLPEAMKQSHEQL